MKVVDIANEIYIDAGSPTSTSIPAISFWIRGKVGTLNVMLYESFYIDPISQEIIDPDNGAPIVYEAIAVLKQMYRIYDYECQIRNTMNALAQDSVMRFEDQGTLVVRVNKNMIAQTLVQVRKDEIQILKDMVARYQLGNNENAPVQVAGDDTYGGLNDDYLNWYPSYVRLG